MAKSILITGATGKQGGAVVDALANDSNFELFAVTRDPTSGSAAKLKAKANNIKVVKGDLNDVPNMFKAAREAAGAPIWGVYSVQISMGKGASFEGEVKQGKDLIDESVKQGVKQFVYSSVDRGGDEESWNNPTPIPHFQTKHQIEQHLRDNAGNMGWTILRPVAFMDNITPGFGMQIFATLLRDSLGPKPLQWVATKDIGIFAKLAFAQPDKFNHKAIGLAGDELDSKQLSQAFKNKTGKPLDGTYSILGSVIKLVAGELAIMVKWFGTDGYKADIPELKKLHPGLMNMETWIEQNNAFPKK